MEKKSKTVSMNPAPKKSEKKQEKLSYEQLEQIANGLNQECHRLQQQLQQAKQTIAETNELGILLAILDKAEHFREEFAVRCADKIEEIITAALDASEKQEETTEGGN